MTEAEMKLKAQRYDYLREFCIASFQGGTTGLMEVLVPVPPDLRFHPPGLKESLDICCDAGIKARGLSG